MSRPTQRPHLSFRLGPERFAIPVQATREILELTPMTRIPSAPAHILGLVNVRGRAVPVVSLRARFGLPGEAESPTARIIVLELEVDGEPTVVGARADAVDEVVLVEPGATDPPPQLGSAWRARVVTGVLRRDDEFVLLLDVAQLFLGQGDPARVEPAA